MFCFFVLFGAKLNLSHMSLFMTLLAAIYLVGRTAGKMFGANFGARISGAPKAIQKYLPLCLFSQAGVAIGLSILAGQRFPGEIGNAIVIIITTTTFIVQIIGPPFIKFAVTKAGEVGLNITEEDLLQKTKVKDIMDKNPPFIYEGMQLPDILKIFSENVNLYYPVVNNEKELRGIITVEGIKQTLMNSDLGGLVLAHDLMEPVIATVNPETMMPEAKEILDKRGIEYLPVVTKNNKVVGFMESRMFNKFISTKIIQLQKKTDSLG